MILNKIISNGTNMYLYIDEKSKEAILIDCVGDIDKIIALLNEYGAKLKYIYLTHLHYDHIGSVAKLKDKTNAKVVISKEDGLNLNNPKYSLKEGIDKIEIDQMVNNKDILKIGDKELIVAITPGHTKGSSCLYDKDEKILFSGDTIFKQSHGRCDLPSGDENDMANSIFTLLKLPLDTLIFPGHGEDTSIGAEKENYLILSDADRRAIATIDENKMLETKKDNMLKEAAEKVLS